MSFMKPSYYYNSKPKLICGTCLGHTDQKNNQCLLDSSPHYGEFKHDDECACDYYESIKVWIIKYIYTP